MVALARLASPPPSMWNSSAVLQLPFRFLPPAMLSYRFAEPPLIRLRHFCLRSLRDSPRRAI